MVVGRVSSLFCAAFALALAFACSSDPAPKEGVGGAAGTSANGGTSAGTTSGGAGAAAAAGGTTGGSASGAATSGAGGAAAGTHSSGSANGGVAQGGSSTAGHGGGGASSAGTSGLPGYLGPGVACELNQQNDADNRCGEGQASCYIQFGATHCGANAAACDPCPDKEECTTIACDEPADCPGGVCCATLGDGKGAVELSRLECQTSCDEYQYVICATVADCPKQFTECGISSSGIRRCFH